MNEPLEAKSFKEKVKVGTAIKRTFQSVGISHDRFYPDVERIPFKNLVGKGEILFKEARILDNIESHVTGEIGKLALLLVEIEGKQYTTASSGMVILDKIQKAIEGKYFPLFGCVIKDSDYYDIR